MPLFFSRKPCRIQQVHTFPAPRLLRLPTMTPGEAWCAWGLLIAKQIRYVFSLGRLSEGFFKKKELLYYIFTSYVCSSYVFTSYVCSSYIFTSYLCSCTSSHLTSALLTSSHLTSAPVTSSHLTSAHLTSTHLASAHLTSSPLTSSLLSSFSLLFSSLVLSALLRRGRCHQEMRLLPPFRTKWR